MTHFNAFLKPLFQPFRGGGLGRGDALQGHDKVAEAALRLTSDFVQSTYRSMAAIVARGDL